MSIVAVDNQVLVWGVRRRAEAGQEAMIERAAHLLGKLKDEGATVVVPAPVLAEHLVPVPLEEHNNAIEALANRAIRITLSTPQPQPWQPRSSRRRSMGRGPSMNSFSVRG